MALKRLGHGLLSAFLLACPSTFVFAQSTTTKITPNPKQNLNANSAVSEDLPVAPLSAPVVSTSSGTTVQVGGIAKANATYYPSPIPGNSKLSQSLDGEVNFLFDRESSWTTSKVDATVGKYLDWGSSYFSVQQLYSGALFANGKGQVSAGRRLEFWSEVDKNWQLGLWEPQYKIEPLRPVDQGLTGIFYQQTSGHWDWVGFVSPIFVPTMGPDIREQDGSLVADSRWYAQPATSGVVMGQQTQFVYSLSIPEMSQLVNNPGSGLRVRWSQNEKTGFWASGNYAYKPINSLFVKYDANLLISGNASSINVVPVVGYAQLYGADFGYNFNSSRLSFSYLEEDPTQKLPTNDSNSDWWQQQPGQLHIYSIHWNSAVKVKGWNENVDMAVDYLRVFENTTSDLDSSGVVHSAILPYQTMFTNAISATAKAPAHFRGKKLVSKIKVLRDFDQKGNIYETEVDLAWTRRWTITAGLDVLSPDDASSSNQDSHFINQFRANDRIYGGFDYVF